MAEQKPKKSKYVVQHPKLYMRVNDKIQAVPVGTELSLTQAQADGFGDKVAKPGTEGTLVDGKIAEKRGGAALPAEVTEALTAMQAKLDAATAENVKLKAAAKKK